MRDGGSRLIERYRPEQRLIHWLGALSFLVLLASGFALLVPALSWLAASGLSRLIHRIAVIPFVVLPVAYVVLLPAHAKALLIESLTFTRDDARWLARMPAYLAGRTRGLPPQGRLNAGQKLHHVATFLAFLTVAASGFILWFAGGRLGPAGLGATAIVHDVSVLVLTVLMIGHVYFTFLYDALPAMRTGFVTEDYARAEHARWLDTLPRDTSAIPAREPHTQEAMP